MKNLIFLHYLIHTLFQFYFMFIVLSLATTATECVFDFADVSANDYSLFVFLNGEKAKLGEFVQPLGLSVIDIPGDNLGFYKNTSFADVVWPPIPGDENNHMARFNQEPAFKYGCYIPCSKKFWLHNILVKI